MNRNLGLEVVFLRSFYDGFFKFIDKNSVCIKDCIFRIYYIKNKILVFKSKCF